jgi:BirA family biotin operon repressor/biotin-[acetyl-CoA-carboxylase] ligase
VVDVRYDGRHGADLASELDLPRVRVFAEVESTMDVAHDVASSGAPAGTLILADAQRAGRGRGGKRWTSPPGTGVWFTLVERPNDATALDVLSLRVGLHVARALDRFTSGAVGLKWPNDLYLHGGKLGGILVETRWRDRRPDWVAIGVGVNTVAPAGVPGAAALGVGVPRLEVLAEVVPAVRAAAAGRGVLSVRELAVYAERDVAAGRACSAPQAGRVAGVAEDGTLLIVTAAGVLRCREGSLVLDGEAA